MESVLKIFIYNFHKKAGTYLLHIIYTVVVKLLRSAHMQVQVAHLGDTLEMCRSLRCKCSPCHSQWENWHLEGAILNC
jgi:hypothetical protein